MSAVAGHIEREPRQPVSHPPETVLTLEQLADWLQLSERKVEELPIRCFYIGNRRRYLAAHVLAWIEKAASDGMERVPR